MDIISVLSLIDCAPSAPVPSEVFPSKLL